MATPGISRRLGAACLQADYARSPRLPRLPILRAIARARDREAALTALYPNWRTAVPLGLASYDLDRVVESGELVSVTWAVGFEPVEASTPEAK